MTTTKTTLTMIQQSCDTAKGEASWEGAATYNSKRLPTREGGKQAA